VCAPGVNDPVSIVSSPPGDVLVATLPSTYSSTHDHSSSEGVSA
jgi:hypothetical protein